MTSNDLAIATGGAVASAFATALLYPIDTVKTKLNLGSDLQGVKYHGVADVVRKTLRSGGLSAFYRGMNTKLGMTILQKFVYFYVYNALKVSFGC